MSTGSRRSPEVLGVSPSSRARWTQVPDRLAVTRALEAPETGPRILFLTGGTALREFSRVLTRYTHNSVHVVTPFDSGGSSARLRATFDMLAVGDLRNRLLALADHTAGPVEPARRVLHTRLGKHASPEQLHEQLDELVSGHHPLMAAVPEPGRRTLCERLRWFAQRMPADFDLRGASLGNLVLAGGYLESEDIEAVLADLGALLGVRGRVLPSVDANLHLAARLADGSEIVGQHKLTGKEHPPLESPVEELFLVETRPGGDPASARPAASPAAIQEICNADLICYPMGSFYSSLLCNTLPRGIGRAISEAHCPKIYVPSTGQDPELLAADPSRAAELLVASLQRDAGGVPTRRLLDCVLLDENPDVYAHPPNTVRIAELGIRRITTELVTNPPQLKIDPDRLAQVLVSLATSERHTAKEDA